MRITVMSTTLLFAVVYVFVSYVSDLLCINVNVYVVLGSSYRWKCGKLICFDLFENLSFLCSICDTLLKQMFVMCMCNLL